MQREFDSIRKNTSDVHVFVVWCKDSVSRFVLKIVLRDRRLKWNHSSRNVPVEPQLSRCQNEVSTDTIRTFLARADLEITLYHLVDQGSLPLGLPLKVSIHVGF